MLINTNIKRIVGGCEIREVRYKESTIWKKKNEYKLIVASDSLYTDHVYINNKELATYYKTIEINDSTFRLNVTFTRRNLSETVKIFINDTIIFNEKVHGEYERDYKGPIYAYNIRKTCNTSILYSDKINSIKVVLS